MVKKLKPISIITGAQWRQFYEHNWPTDWYIDDIEVDFENDNGEYILDDESTNPINNFGRVGWQGTGTPPEGIEKHVLYEVHWLYNKTMSSLSSKELNVSISLDDLLTLISITESVQNTETGPLSSLIERLKSKIPPN